MSRTAARLALVFALLGLGASLAAAYTHYRLIVDPGYVSFCDVSETMSCSQVYSSRYGAIGGIPVAVFGSIWFAVALLLSAAAVWGPPTVRESVPGYLFAGSTLALAMILYLGYASFVVLGLVCVLCVATYVAVIGLFLVSGGATSVPMTSLPRRAASDMRTLFKSPVAIAVAGLTVALSVWALVAFPRDTVLTAASGEGGTPATRDERAEFERWYTAQQRFTIPIDPEGARVLVVKFNDYQCPPCRQTFNDYKAVWEKFQASHPGQIRVVTRDFPLEKECNSLVTTEFHAAACEAAVAVRLARPLGTADALEQWIFDNQPAMTPQLVRQGARDVGKVQDFDAKYAATLELVKADIALGREFGVQSTPTFFLNGVKIEGGLPIQYFEQAIAYELERASPQ